MKTKITATRHYYSFGSIFQPLSQCRGIHNIRPDGLGKEADGNQTNLNLPVLASTPF